MKQKNPAMAKGKLFPFSSTRFSLGTWFFHDSIGAQRVQKLCIAFRNYCEELNTEG
jgi:hypothetical protein